MLYMKSQIEWLQVHMRLLLAFLLFIPIQCSISASENEFRENIELIFRENRNYDDDFVNTLAEVIDNTKDMNDKIKGYVVFGAVLCEIPGREEQAQIVFKRIPRMERNLSANYKDFIDSIANNCGNEEPIDIFEKLTRKYNETAAVAGVIGKNDVAGVIGKDGDVVGHIAGTDFLRKLESRLYKKSQREECVRNIEHLVGSEYVVKSYGDFVVAVQGDEELAQSVLTQLQDILMRFCKLYDMEAPEYLVTVYLTRDDWAMVQLAHRVHGIDISQLAFGYTCKADSSIVVRISGGLGTLGHEVFHAMLDHNFSEAPPWLNEGMACLYEEYQTTPNGGILGTFRRNHWRLVNSPLSSDPSAIEEVPSIKQIVRMDWETFNARGYSPEKARLNHLIAKMFIMFLQDKRLLKPVFNQLRDIGIDDIKEPIEDIEIHTLETVCGKELDAIQTEFNEWLLDKLQN